MKNSKMKYSDYMMNGMIYTIIGMYLFILYFWFGVIFLYIYEREYSTVSILLILSGVVVIAFGYLVKYTKISGNKVENFYNKLKKKQELNERLIFHEKVTIWIDRGCLIKICNIIGMVLICIGVILLGIYIFIL
ncbi:hypothetical protein [Aliarcobacter lanthieri]|uniref:hypothetical protein n=1 Tax=Aliarcobacter lanthieri TaxID=1355374 RepID=UPI003AAFBD00